MTTYTREFIPCRKCKQKEGSRIPTGYYLDPNVKEGIIECVHHIEWKNFNSSLNKYIKNGFREDLFFLDYPDGYVGEKSRDNVIRLKNFINKFIEGTEVRKASLYFHGPQGCQKTLTAGWIAAELTRAGFDCRFIHMHKLVSVLWDSQRSDLDRDLMERLSNSDLLVIDESFDKDKVGMWASGKQLSHLDLFIRNRERKRATIYISNIGVDKIDEKLFGVSLKDLLTRVTTTYFDHSFEFLDNYKDLTHDIPKEKLF